MLNFYINLYCEYIFISRESGDIAPSDLVTPMVSGILSLRMYPLWVRGLLHTSRSVKYSLEVAEGLSGRCQGELDEEAVSPHQNQGSMGLLGCWDQRPQDGSRGKTGNLQLGGKEDST